MKSSFTRLHVILLGISSALVGLGLWLLSLGPWDNPYALTLAPLVLVVTYFVIVPAALLWKPRSDDQNT